MSLQRFLTDNVFFENENGERTGPYKTKFGSNKLIIFNDKLMVKDGDIVIQPLPNGTEDRFVVIDTNFNSGLKSIKAHYSISTVKESKQQKEEKMATNTILHINNSNVQVGDGNVQNIVNSFNELVKEIDESQSTQEEKEVAKSLLNSLVSNPTVASVLGGTVSGLVGLM